MTKRKRFKHLSVFDRAIIGQKRKEGLSYGEIRKIIDRPKSTVFREVEKRKSKKLGFYKADVAHEKALNKRGKRGVSVRERLKNETIRSYVKEKLKLGWSPEQIALRLPIDHPGETISYEAIYQYVYAQVYRGGSGMIKEGGEDLRKYLPRRHKRRAKKGFRKAQKLERMGKLPSIEDRPKEAEGRKEIGHWEDDTMVSRQSVFRLKSINERASGVVFLGKMRDGTSEESTRVVCERLSVIPSSFRKTLTRDRGTENTGWTDIEKTLSLSVHFAHSYCSYERGSNENLNGLARRFFPKKTDFAKVSNEEIKRVECLLNTRPRKRFGGKTPLEVLLEKTGVAITY